MVDNLKLRFYERNKKSRDDDDMIVVIIRIVLKDMKYFPLISHLFDKSDRL